MTLLRVEGLRKAFFGVDVVKEVSFAVGAGQALGLIGENGSGKSTCMNIVGGLITPDAGQMFLDEQPYAPASPQDADSARVAFIHQELNLFENLTVAENLSIGEFPRHAAWLPVIDKRQVRLCAIALLQQVELEVTPETPLNRLAQGERQLVEIAKALSGDPRVIIFDEPTTSLTTREAQRLFALIARMKERGIGIIYISHILEDVLRLCDRVVTLRDGSVVDECDAASLTIERMVRAMLGRPMTEFFPGGSGRRPSPGPALTVLGLTQPGALHNLSFTVSAGEIVGVAGLMGSGRSETARVLFGLDPAAEGEVIVDGIPLRERSPRLCMAAGMAFLTEDRRGDGLMMAEGVTTNIELASLADASANAFVNVRTAELARRTQEATNALHIRARDMIRQAVRSLSGGNQQKVVLGKWLLREPKIFILDEPTRGIDVGAKSEIYSLIEKLAARGTAVLMISSEFEELFAICDRILTMAHGEIVAEFAGPNYDRAAVFAAATHAQARGAAT